MLAFIMGSSLGLALGWLAFLLRSRIGLWIILYTGPAVTIIYMDVVLPLASFSGATDRSLWEAALFMWDHIVSDFMARVFIWSLVFGIPAHIAAAVWHKGMEPEEAVPETREQTRHRVRADMKYTDHYFD